MSEPMVVELIVESEWILKDYWTKIRFPYKTEKGGWSDVDVIAYQPETKHLVIAESKVRGSKKYLHGYNQHAKNDYGSFVEYFGTGNKGYLSFIENLSEICKDGVIFTHQYQWKGKLKCKPFAEMVQKLTIQFVSNTVIDSELKDEAENAVLEKVQRKLSKVQKAGVKVEVRLDSTLEVIAKVIDLENKDKQGRRYGHPMLDIAREINRYTNPALHNAGHDKTLKQQAIQPLRKVIRSDKH